MKSLANIIILSALVSLILCDPYPSNYTDAGVQNGKQMCLWARGSYGRGVGYPWKFGDGLNLNGAMSRCQNDNRDLGCEQWGAVIYPKCREGFKNDACCICDPIRSYCPNGWRYLLTTEGNDSWICIQN